MAQDEKRVPRLVPDVELTRLELTPVEGFVLSRVDGFATVREILDLTGLPESQVTDTLQKLLGLGAIEWTHEGPLRPSWAPGPPSRPSTPPGAATPTRGVGPSATPSRGIVRTKPPPPGVSRSLYDPAELEEDVELDLERRRAVLDTFYRMEELDYYELLGVSRDADKQTVRTAYFKLSKVFHPDTLFGKRLGSYKAKMEAVFRALTEAYEVLGKKKKRTEYDEYLLLRDQTRAAQMQIEEGRRTAEALERQASQAAARAIVEPGTFHAAPTDGATEEPAGAGTDHPARTADAPPAEEVSARPSSAPSPTRPSSPKPPVSDEERRRRTQELIARRLASVTGRRPATAMPQPSGGPATRPRPRSRPASPPAPPTKDALLKGLATSLKRAAAVTGGVDRTERHVATAREAEASGDLVGAANSLRLALALAPDREDIKEAYRRIYQRLTVSLADTYVKQAMYEEKMEKWAEAVLSWTKVSEGRPEDADAFRRAAAAVLRTDEPDFRKARDMAQRSVDLLPDSAEARRVLGEVFLRAGMKLNAKRELEAAAKLDPSDEMVKNLLRELKA